MSQELYYSQFVSKVLILEPTVAGAGGERAVQPTTRLFTKRNIQQVFITQGKDTKT